MDMAKAKNFEIKATTGGFVFIPIKDEGDEMTKDEYDNLEDDDQAFAYESMRNSKTDFPVLACAAGNWAGQTRVVIGARPARAMVLTDEQGILKNGITEETAAAFAAYAAANTPTSGNIRAGAAYRTHLIEVLTKRALLGLGGN